MEFEEKSCGCIIIDNKKVLLIESVQGNWGFPKGHVEEDETEVQTAIREVKEETNLDVKIDEGKKYTLQYITDKGTPKQVVLFVAKKIGGQEKCQECEIKALEWMNFNDAINRITYDNTKMLFKEALKELKQKESYDYIGNIVQVKIDRPLNSKHPKHDFVYSVNYGFVPNTISGDGEELDCYVLGIDKPIESFEGKCIAVIHRTNDDDDKLIVVPEGTDYTDEEIRELTNFQEQYFESEIIR